MQFIPINLTTKLKDIFKYVGKENTSSLLSANGLTWGPDIGKQFIDKCNNILKSVSSIDWPRKSSILNTFTQDDDVFEKAALADDSEWKLLSSLGTFSGMLKVPETLTIMDSFDVLGSGISVPKKIYDTVMDQLSKYPHTVDPSIFESNKIIAKTSSKSSSSNTNAMKWFRLPWGEITLHSSLDNESIDFPCYPQEPSDSRKANYTQMPDLLYQYEPWQIYQSSGPRSNTYTFDIHRHMWTGDHNDGMANKLIRFCEAHCYPRFNGSLVNTSIATLYIHGKPLIRGVITDVQTNWDGPIADDGWPLHFKLQLSITEVSSEPLNYDSIKNKPLIG